MRWLSRSVCAALVLGLGCQEEAEHPPPPPECPIGEPRCGPFEPPPSNSFGGNTGSGGRSSSAEGGVGGAEAGAFGFPDAGGPGEGGAPNSVDLEGEVVQYVDTGFETTNGYFRNAVLEAEGYDETRVSALATDSGRFLLEGVRYQLPIWLSVRAEADRAGEVRTLHPIVDFEKPVQAALVTRNLLEVIAFGALSQPFSWDEKRAQAVLFMVDRKGNQLEGVLADLPAAELIAYQRRGQYTDSPGTGTDLSGVIAFGNIDARAYPGNDLRVSFHGRREGWTEIRVAAGAVTMANIVIE
jgi:hypothetical protein